MPRENKCDPKTCQFWDDEYECQYCPYDTSVKFKDGKQIRKQKKTKFKKDE